MADTPLPASTYVLQSFNLLDINLLHDLSQIVNNLIDVRPSPLPPEFYSHIKEQTAGQVDTARFEVSKTQMDSFTRIASSFGVTGSYGVFSGSVQASYASERFRAATAFSSSSVGTINMGTTGYNGSVTAILQLLSVDFSSALRAINSLKAAKKFVDAYGTHLALSWNLGGCFSIQIEAGTKTYADKRSIEASAEAAFDSVASVSASASAAYQLNQSGSAYDLRQSLFAAGGDAALAAQINLQTNEGLAAWLASCSTQTTYGLYKMVSLADLATDSGLAAQGQWLQQYFDLAMLAYSLQNPQLFTADVPLVPGSSTQVVAVAHEHFKIISGGAALDQNVSSWLTGCQPQMAGDAINGWMAGSHDIYQAADPSTHLTSYALAAFDPGNLLNVQTTQTPGTNPNAGPDSASAPLSATSILTGGGVGTDILSGLNSKYIESSFPVDGRAWKATTHDYGSGANAQTTVYAVGITCLDLEIDPTLVVTRSASPQSHGNETAVLGAGLNVVGGGVKLENQGGFGNLVQQTYPSGLNTWEEYNKDSFGNVTLSVASAYAIGLRVAIKGVSEQPALLSPRATGT
jgi:hypothetical protein